MKNKTEYEWTFPSIEDSGKLYTLGKDREVVLPRNVKFAPFECLTEEEKDFVVSQYHKNIETLARLKNILDPDFYYTSGNLTAEEDMPHILPAYHKDGEG